MVRQSDRAVILADHSKIGAPARSVFCPVAEIDHLVVDEAARLRPGFDDLAKVVPGLIVARG
jgi:DeoR/GlpR family transcriptional regulator of sugar metabolism